MSHRLFVLLLIIIAGLAAVAAAPAPFTREVARTAQGTFVVYHRVPATAADLEMPIVGAARTQESFAYRVRDRKQRDVLRYVRVVFTSERAAAATTTYYAGVLGAAALRETDATTGAVTLTAGTKDNFRLAQVTPAGEGCTVRLERVQRFSYPPRVYTEAEARVVRVLSEVAATYRQAGHLTVDIAQTAELSPAMGDQKPPTLSWHVDYTRPAAISVTATVNGALGLQITTEGKQLRVARPDQETELRPFSGPLDLTVVPELRGDPVMRLLFGEDLLARRVDALALSAVPGDPRLQRMTLTFPDEDMTIALVIDRRANTVARSEVYLTGEDGRWTRMVRAYTYQIVESSLPAPASTDAVPHRSQTELPAVTGP